MPEVRPLLPLLHVRGRTEVGHDDGEGVAGTARTTAALQGGAGGETVRIDLEVISVLQWLYRLYGEHQTGTLPTWRN